MSDRLVDGRAFRILTGGGPIRPRMPFAGSGHVDEWDQSGQLSSPFESTTGSAEQDHRGQRLRILQQGDGRLGLWAFS
jgi:hypothetical protein